MNGVSWNESSVQSILSYLGGLTAGNASFGDQHGVAPMNPLPMAFTRVHLHQIFSNDCNKPSVSTGPTNSVSAVHMGKGVTLPCAGIETVKGIPQIQPGEVCGDSEMLTDSGLKQLYSYLNLSLEESAANITSMLDLNTSETAENSLKVLYCHQNGMKLASNEDPSNGGHSNNCQSHCAVTVTDPAKPPEFHGLHGAVSSHASTSKGAMNHRIRRSRIAKAVKELEELVPKSGKFGRESVLDDAIEYVKLLKLQVQGYGHYLLHDHMVREPLEEQLGQLMETNTAAASHLLERKGLYVIPMALAHDLLQTE
ncbi:hypothetical protein ACLOJK_018603 [Asimina triloba]